jgi:hypothetical protein
MIVCFVGTLPQSINQLALSQILCFDHNMFTGVAYGCLYVFLDERYLGPMAVIF